MKTDPRHDPDSALLPEGEEAEEPRIGRLLLRFGILVLLIIGGFVLLRYSPAGEYLDRERLVGLFGSLQEAWWAPLALVAAFVVISPLGLPISPLMFAGGVVFGGAWGGTLNLLGSFLGAGVTYLVGRIFGRDLFVHLGGKRLRRAERMIARRGFWPLVGIRFLPLPFPIVNYGAALGGVSPGRFLLTTALGLAPAVYLWTHLASSLYKALVEGREDVSWLQPALALGLVFLLTVVPPFVTGRRRKKRLGMLQGERAQQGRKGSSS